MPTDVKALKQDLTRRMEGAMETLKKEFSGLRTGRASPALLEPVRVEAYGSVTPLNQVANISVAGPGLLAVQVWDKGLAKAVESAIREANLGRNELAKAAARYAEQARVAVRGVRRDGMEQIKAAGKKSELGEDEVKRAEEEVQKLTDQFVKQIDAALVDKDKDIRTV
jgi:ribosome recycling factor